MFIGVSHVPIWDPEKKSTLIRWSRANDSQCDALTNYMYDNFLECMYQYFDLTHYNCTCKDLSKMIM